MDIKAAINEVEQNIAAAKAKSNRAEEEVLLIAVTKTQSADTINEAMAAGHMLFGENRVQELLAKYDLIPGAIWHLIGHLQTNKVKYIIDKVAMIESLDRLELAWEIEKRAAALCKIMPVLVRVNIAEEESKFGLREEATVGFMQEMVNFPHIKVMGLMTIGPYVCDAEEIRPVFARLRQLKDEVASMHLPHIDMKYLSMGMSNDYQVAVEEGANIVRVGSSIFGLRN